MTDGDAPLLPDYLRADVNRDARTTPGEPKQRSRRPLALIAALVVASAAVGSAITFGVTRNSGTTAKVVNSASTTTSTIGPNEVIRIDEPAELDGWALVVKRFRVVSALRGYPRTPGHHWLVVDAQLTNRTARVQTFTADMVEARTMTNGSDDTFVSAVTGEAWQPPPHGTIAAEFVFSVAASGKTFSVVLRRGLEAQKQRGDSVEIDLNCC